MPTNSKPPSEPGTDKPGTDKPDIGGPQRRFHGRRKGRPLRKGRAALVDSLLPALRIALPQAGTIDLDQVFGAPKPAYWLEIGFGAGEHLAWQARAHPDIGMVGCEVFSNGVASLLRHVAENELDNVRIHNDDARALMDVLPDRSLDRLFLLHPDPWPKYRHANRRFVQQETIAALARLLKPGGILRIATDHPTYLGWTLRHMAGQPWFEWTARSAADWRQRPDDWPATRYEQKALRDGRRCTYLQYLRRKCPPDARKNRRGGPL